MEPASSTLTGWSFRMNDTDVLGSMTAFGMKEAHYTCKDELQINTLKYGSHTMLQY